MTSSTYHQKNAVTDGTKIRLIGNKEDLEDDRAVPCNEGMRFAEENQMRFVKTAAKTGANVNEAFQHLVNQPV